jgi:peptidoglycan hydrolase CwlO-like protein
MSTALITALSVVSAAGISALFAWLSHRGNAKVEQVHAVLEAYNEIVRNLQNELQRVQTELETARNDMRDCEQRSVELRAELEQMKLEMAGLRAVTEPVPVTRRRPAKS